MMKVLCNSELNSKAKTQVQTQLSSWYLLHIPGSKSLRLCGKEHNASLVSTPIHIRVSATTVISTSGVTYKLLGPPINIGTVPESLYAFFTNGFPENWTTLLENYLSNGRVVGGKASSVSEPFKDIKVRKKISKWSFFVAKQLVHVEGLTDDNELFRTSPIIYASTSSKVVTVSGNAYSLRGNLYFQAFLTSGYPLKLLQSFKYGFPPNWRSLIKKYLKTEVHLDVTNENNDITLNYPSSRRKADSGFGNSAPAKKHDQSVPFLDNYHVSSSPMDRNMESGIGELHDSNPVQGKVLVNISNRSSELTGTKAKLNSSRKSSATTFLENSTKAARNKHIVICSEDAGEESGEIAKDHAHIKDCYVAISPMVLRSRSGTCRKQNPSLRSQFEESIKSVTKTTAKKKAQKKSTSKAAPKPRKRTHTSSKPHAKNKGKRAAKKAVAVPAVAHADKENVSVASEESTLHSSRVEQTSGVDNSMMTPTRVLNTSKYSVHQRLMKQRAQSMKRKQLALDESFNRDKDSDAADVGEPPSIAGDQPSQPPVRKKEKLGGMWTLKRQRQIRELAEDLATAKKPEDIFDDVENDVFKAVDDDDDIFGQGEGWLSPGWATDASVRTPSHFETPCNSSKGGSGFWSETEGEQTPCGRTGMLNAEKRKKAQAEGDKINLAMLKKKKRARNNQRKTTATTKVKTPVSARQSAPSRLFYSPSMFKVQNQDEDSFSDQDEYFELETGQ